MANAAGTLYAQDNIHIGLEHEPDGMFVRFTGIIDQPKPGEFLDPLIARVHEDALSGRPARVAADLSGLSFLNSSGIMALAKWVMKLKEAPANQRYPLTLLYAPGVTWQQTSLKPLVMMSGGLVTLEPV